VKAPAVRLTGTLNTTAIWVSMERWPLAAEPAATPLPALSSGVTLKIVGATAGSPEMLPVSQLMGSFP
jgi:hypothetical protein